MFDEIQPRMVSDFFGIAHVVPIHNPTNHHKGIKPSVALRGSSNSIKRSFFFGTKSSRYDNNRANYTSINGKKKNMEANATLFHYICAS